MSRETSRRLRSDCPVNFAVETLGDKWSLVILRDIIFWGKHTYGEFLKSDERIATNILANRLENLENEGLISRSPHATDKRKDLFNVTEKGVELIPVLIEMVAWSAKNETWQSIEHHGTVQQQRLVERAVKTKNKYRAIEQFKERVRNGGYIFEGVEQPSNPRTI
jgi:DNA-binding HxlR family transcriptional regulator